MNKIITCSKNNVFREKNIKNKIYVKTLSQFSTLLIIITISSPGFSF